MNKESKKILSVALAGSILASAPLATNALAEGETNTQSNTLYEEVMPNETVYYVQEGDTMGKICEKFYGNSAFYELLAAYNYIEDANVIYAGQRLFIPTQLMDLFTYTEAHKEVEPVVVAEVYPADQVYTVCSGDTLTCIAFKYYGQDGYGLIDKLATYNNMYDPNLMDVGDVILIPCKEKLAKIVANDYTAQYQALYDRINGITHECPPIFIPCPRPEMPMRHHLYMPEHYGHHHEHHHE